MLTLITVISLLFIVYAYAGYPLLLAAISRSRSGPVVQATPKMLSFTIIIAARNEEEILRQKLENTLSLHPVGERPQIIVASDASEDRTDEITESFAPAVELVRSPERRGKEWVQALAVGQARGEIVVFTDAKVMLEPNALEQFARYFVEEDIGAVSSSDRAAGASGESVYVRYEMLLRRLETRFRTLVGLSGSCFAVRRTICENMRTDIPSDFALLLAAVKQGLRGVLAEEIVATYQTVSSPAAEFERKTRTVLRGMTALFATAEVLNPLRYGSFSWQIVSHKLLRWLVPWFAVLVGIGSVLRASSSAGMLVLADCVLVGILLALLGYLYPRLQRFLPVRLVLFFIISNAAIAHAWVGYFGGTRAVLWTPSAKGR